MKRTIAMLLGSAALTLPGPAQAGTPDPTQSSVVLSGNSLPCHFRFRPDAGLDAMLVTVTVNDENGDPCEDCPVLITVSGTPITPPELFCSCCPAQTVNTDPGGVALATFAKIGGAGTLEVSAVAQCGGNVALESAYFPFTSTDLTGDCDPTSSQTIHDDALLALGRNPFAAWVDFDCSGGFTITDFAVYVGGTSKGCSMSACP